MGHYEEEVSGSTTEIRHYSFGSLRIAVKRGSTLYHSTFWPERVPLTSRELANIPAEAKKLHGDHSTFWAVAGARNFILHTL